MNFATNAKRLVDSFGWSDRELSRRLKERGVKASPTTVGRWLSGATEPSIGDAMALADLLGESLDILVGRKQEEFSLRLSPDERAIVTFIRSTGLTLSEIVQILSSPKSSLNTDWELEQIYSLITILTQQAIRNSKWFNALIDARRLILESDNSSDAPWIRRGKPIGHMPRGVAIPGEPIDETAEDIRRERERLRGIRPQPKAKPPGPEKGGGSEPGHKGKGESKT